LSYRIVEAEERTNKAREICVKLIREIKITTPITENIKPTLN